MTAKEEEEDDKKKKILNTDHSTTDSSNEPKKLYGQALPVEARREREDRDILKLSQNSSTFFKKDEEF